MCVHVLCYAPFIILYWYNWFGQWCNGKAVLGGYIKWELYQLWSSSSLSVFVCAAMQSIELFNRPVVCCVHHTHPPSMVCVFVCLSVHVSLSISPYVYMYGSIHICVWVLLLCLDQCGCSHAVICTERSMFHCSRGYPKCRQDFQMNIYISTCRWMYHR